MSKPKKKMVSFEEYSEPCRFHPYDLDEEKFVRDLKKCDFTTVQWLKCQASKCPYWRRKK